jgi:hypothetical protein
MKLLSTETNDLLRDVIGDYVLILAENFNKLV